MLRGELRPVFAEEMELLGFDRWFSWRKGERRPLLYAHRGIYYYRGFRVLKISGGRFDVPPEVTFLGTPLSGTRLEPEERLWDDAHMDELEERTIARIRDVVEGRKNWSMHQVCFSGGKDSQVLLDIVSRALPSCDYIVCFGDTGMELSDTYRIADDTERWCDANVIHFVRVKSHLDAPDSWRLFGPPSRTCRWCCSVHKSTPQRLDMARRIDPERPFFTITGVRASESARRAEYKEIEPSHKSANTMNFNPLLKWSLSDIWAYLFRHNIHTNRAYRFGLGRVGCICCPMAGVGRNAYISSRVYHDEVQAYMDVIEESFRDNYRLPVREFVRRSLWSGRKTGERLNHPLDNYLEWDEIPEGGGERAGKGERVIVVTDPLTDWRLWAQTLPKSPVRWSVQEEGGRLEVRISREDMLRNRSDVRKIRNVFKKAAACVGCRTCEAMCPHNRLHFDERGKPYLIGCLHCGGCHNVPEGCLRWESLHKKAGGCPEKARPRKSRKEKGHEKARAKSAPPLLAFLGPVHGDR